MDATLWTETGETPSHLCAAGQNGLAWRCRKPGREPGQARWIAPDGLAEIALACGQE